uniref:Nudix hydrolase domain-containing protein n=1 Tax=viral metagenome TaxID=1070528 RepID=A0A6H1ZTZ2_9ZZZZ
MKEYVVGFAFDHSCKAVLLISKSKPEWQKGHLNGIGGKIEKGELPIQAMVREFKEETGIETDHSDWIYYCLMTAEEEEICYYYMIGGAHEAYSITDEVVEWFEVDDLPPNLNWLIPLALENDFQRSKGINLFVKATYTRKGKDETAK